ncbi:MAG TPA: MFS transporter [Rhizomicrobium sp.]|jgi:GPH family glycoside/pentoside/hexuronide:cation symporter
MADVTEEIVVPLNPQAANHTARAERLGFGTLALYGSGMLVQDTLGLGLGTLLLFYLTVICGMSGSIAGLALGFALVADAFFDPWVGSISDNSRSRYGRRHPFMLVSALPIAIGYGLLFSVPVGLTGIWLFVYALAMLMIIRVGLSFFQVPYIALGAELSDDYAERSTIVASRVLFTVVAATSATYLAYGVFLKGHDGQLVRAAYAPLAWVCGALVVLGGALATFGTMSSRHRLHEAPPGQDTGTLFAEVVEVFRNRSFTILFGACLVLFIGLGFAASIALHANTYFWKLQPGQILIIALVLYIGYFVGVFIAMALTRFMEKRWIAVLGIALIGVGQFAPAAQKVAGIIPASAGVTALVIASALTGIGASCSLIGFQSMMADAADEHEMLFNARREGMYFAGISFSAKASSGIGSLLAGVVLDLIHFPQGVGSTAVVAAHIPAGTVLRLGLMQGPGAAAITAISVLVLMLYRRGRREHEEVREILVARRETRE